MATHIFGIRHHGPGSARHLVQALETIKPGIILLEGPPEAESILSWAASESMEPPVAILAYVPENPHRAVYYPFTHYSPEWQAICYGLQNKISIRFIDMPLRHSLELMQLQESKNPEEDENLSAMNSDDSVESIKNPMAYLASLAGFDDEEEWWEQHFELSHENPLALFETVKQMVGVLREELPETEQKSDLQREVFMRKNIRQAENELYDTIAVVCGAWHAPVLEKKYTAKQEKELIGNLSSTKVECCWIPWTNDRLMFESGYGAGILSPGWYEHQWNHPDDDGTMWLTLTARVFRMQKMDISPAHVIETVRLANALTALRNNHRTGLKEYTEAIQTVMCMGESIPLALLKKELIVGNRLGAIPSDTPQSPLQIDFEKQLKSLRLKTSEGEQILNLDLRKSLDLQKSIFLHRLEVLEVNWGKKQGVNSKGTFREIWNLYWKPEMLIELIAKSSMGNTIELAANTWLKEMVQKQTELKVVSQWLELAVPAELSTATEALLAKMDTLAASASDIGSLIASLFPLSEILKYGNVRNSDKIRIHTIFQSIFSRSLVGLPTGCTGINDDQATLLANQIRDLHKVVQVLDEDSFSEDWRNSLVQISQNRQTAPFVAGMVHKICYESRMLSSEETAQAFSRALSTGTAISDSARWLEGFLNDAATILLLDEGIWSIVYSWVEMLDEEIFKNLLPLLRRTFSNYSQPEKDKIAKKVKFGKHESGSQRKKTTTSNDFENERAIQLIPTIEYLLGL